MHIPPPGRQQGPDYQPDGKWVPRDGSCRCPGLEESQVSHLPGRLDTTLPKSLRKNTEAQAPQPGTESMWGVARASRLLKKLTDFILGAVLGLQKN